VAEESGRASGGGPDIWARADAVATIASKLLIPVVLVIIGHLLSSSLREREALVRESDLQRAWVELALDVLRDENLADAREMRAWSVSVINYYVPNELDLTDDLRAGLVEGEVSFPSPGVSSIVGPHITAIQTAMHDRGICGSGFFVDSVAGPRTWSCLAAFLQDASTADARALLAASPELVLRWVQSGVAPADWRKQAEAALATLDSAPDNSRR